MKFTLETIASINEKALDLGLETIEIVKEKLTPIKEGADLLEIERISIEDLKVKSVDYFFGDEEHKKIAVTIMVRRAAKMMQVWEEYKK